jgi:hypothetical protein
MTTLTPQAVTTDTQAGLYDEQVGACVRPSR